MNIFFDANALIYLIEAKSSFAQQIKTEIQAVASAYPQAQLTVSRLSWLECRVYPMKHQQVQILALYDEFFASVDLVWVELSAEVVEWATMLRAQYGLRTPDALQAASCLSLDSAHIFFTADRGFHKVLGLNVHLLTGCHDEPV